MKLDHTNGHKANYIAVCHRHIQNLVFCCKTESVIGQQMLHLRGFLSLDRSRLANHPYCPLYSKGNLGIGLLGPLVGDPAASIHMLVQQLVVRGHD